MKRSNSPAVNSRSTSPDRNIKRKLNHQTIHKHSRSQKTQQHQHETDMKNHDVCDACGDVGQFLCCDACPKSFHFTCVEPPMDFNDIENLKDKWYCTECHYMKNKSKIPRSNPRGLFQKLIDDVSTKNPKSYRLPDDIIHFFEGVSIDKQGKYVDITQIKRRGKNGQVEQPDHHQLKDKSGRYFVCYYCRKTALKQPLIPCDYCSLHWHLDCLNPPLAAPPNPLKKWRCPNHIENVVKPPRTQKDPMVINEKSPYCAYQNYLNTIVDDNEIINKLVFKSTSPIKSSTPAIAAEDIIARKDGPVYRLPVKPFQIDFTNYTKKTIKSKKHTLNHRRNSIPSTLTSSSSSEVSTPPTVFTSPITSHKPMDTHFEDKNEVDDWLHTMTSFRAGTMDEKKILIQELSLKEDHLAELIKAAVEPTSSSAPTTKVNASAYHRYQKIESLLRQKDSQELLAMLNH